jgi:hypothetical protein
VIHPRWGKIVGEVSPARTREGVPGQGIQSGIASHERGEKRNRTGARAMYTGTLIKEIMAIVERSEARIRDANPENELEHWYASQHQSVHVDADLVGVA